MKKKILFICMALFFPNILVVAQPQPNMPEGRVNRVVAKLKLTDEQQKKFKDLTYQFQKDMVDLRSKIQKNRIELKKIADDGAVDEKKLLQLSDESNKIRGDIKNLAVKKWIDVNRMLNKDQQEIWAKHLGRCSEMGMRQSKMKERMKEGLGRFMKHRRSERMHDSDIKEQK